MQQQKTLRQQSSARLDKWLWAARIFKTRTVAANACKNGRVSVTTTETAPEGRVTTDTVLHAALAKASRTLRVGEIVHVRKAPVTYSFRVLNCIEQRVGARLLPQVYENVTQQSQYELLEMSHISGFIDRQRGTGRPTKKERRALDTFADIPTFGYGSDDDGDDLFDFDE